MEKLRFPLVVLVIIGGLVGAYAYSTRDKPASQERIGIEHEDQGREHNVEPNPDFVYNSNPPTSGPHYQVPAQWGESQQTVPDFQTIHNLEHGGIIVAYKPDLPKDQVEKLRKLLYEKTRPNFVPTKVIMMPRAANAAPISLASWRRTLDLQEFNEETIVQFYLTNAGKSPEPTAQ